jgi:hypothetical protein
MTGKPPRQLWFPVWIALLFLVQPAVSELSFTAKVDRQRTTRTQPIRLTLTLSSTQNIAHVPQVLIDLRAFDYQGPSIGTRVEMSTNGGTTFARDLTYALYARKAGRLTIPAARIELQGQVLQTKPITIEVTVGQRSPNQRREGNAVEDNLFIRVTTDHERVYVGQQLTVIYDLCYRYQLRDVGFSEIPSFAGFWVKDLYVAQSLDPKREDIGQLAFNVSTLRQNALFPTRSGAHRIDPLVMSCSIPKSGRRRGSLFDSIFDDPFFGRSQTHLVRSEAIEVEALPLPKSGQPDDFSGAVGRFAISVEAQPRSVPVGDPVTVRVRVEGEGNFQAVGVPVLADIDGFKVYDPKQIDEEGIVEDRYAGSRTLDYILIPERAGSLKIPAVSFSYFNPSQVVYETVESASIEIDSHGEVADAGESLFPLTRTEIMQVGSDIRHIKPDVTELSLGGRLYSSVWFWLVQGLIPLTYLGFLVAHRHRMRLQGDAAYARRKRARSQATRRLEKAGHCLDAGDGPGFYDAIDQALRAYLADNANVSEAGLTKQECASLAAEICDSDDADTVSALVAVMERCEHARYARAASTPKEMRSAYDTALQILDTLAKGKTTK